MIFEFQIIDNEIPVTKAAYSLHLCTMPDDVSLPEYVDGVMYEAENALHTLNDACAIQAGATITHQVQITYTCGTDDTETKAIDCYTSPYETFSMLNTYFCEVVQECLTPSQI